MGESGPWETHYFISRRGDSPVQDFLGALPLKARAKCFAYIDALEAEGLSLPACYVKKVADDLWELRPEYGGTEYRFFYFTLVRRRFVIVHAVAKKSQRLKTRDVKLALDRVRETRERLQEGEDNADSKLQEPSPIRPRTD